MSMTEKTGVVIEVILSDAEAWQLAQFVKRLTFDDCLRRTTGGYSEGEAYLMIAATNKVGRALASVGYAPR